MAWYWCGIIDLEGKIFFIGTPEGTYKDLYEPHPHLVRAWKGTHWQILNLGFIRDANISPEFKKSETQKWLKEMERIL